MSLPQFLLFFFSTFLISATPGPNMLLAFQQGLNYGVRAALWTLAGLSAGLFLLLLTALLGIDIISRQLPWLLTAVKGVGAFYLAYLGIQSWRHAKDNAELLVKPITTSHNGNRPSNNAHAAAITTLKSPWRRFCQGVWVSLSNPKAILFFAAFFPKFINFSAPLLPQYLLLTLGFYISETTWQMAYTIGGTKLADWLGSGSRLLWLNRSCGVIFILIALALMWEVVAMDLALIFSH